VGAALRRAAWVPRRVQPGDVRGLPGGAAGRAASGAAARERGVRDRGFLAQGAFYAAHREEVDESHRQADAGVDGVGELLERRLRLQARRRGRRGARRSMQELAALITARS
jgi:hypothetical protein